MQGVEVEPNNPHVFWSAAEDGTVRQYDTRLPINCQKAWESSNCLLSVKAVGPASANRSIELKGISLNKVALCCWFTFCSRQHMHLCKLVNHKHQQLLNPYLIAVPFASATYCVFLFA